MKIFKHTHVFLFAIGLFIVSCGKDDPEVPIEEEVITTLRYTLSPSGGGSDIILSFVDLDGDGGDDPVITGGTLNVNSTYTGSITLANESESPAENITEEIEEQDEEHQFFFSSSITGLTISYNDSDTDGKPIGLSNSLTTGDSGTGSITVTLRHEPDKNATGVSDGDISNAGGETDIEVSFPIEVK